MKGILTMGVAAGMMLAGGWAHASLSQTFNVGSPSGTITAGNPVPTQFTGTFNQDPNSLDTVVMITVGLNVSGGYSGNFYLALTGPDGNTTTVLLNSPGTSTSGVNITLQDGASGITSSSDLSSGTYAPYAPLSGLNGQTADGTWTLSFADSASGVNPTLISWTLNITAVPEPVTTALGVFAGLAGLGLGLGKLRKRLAKIAPPEP